VELQEEVERLRGENSALKVATQSANTQIKSPLWPYGDKQFGYPWGYDKNNGWLQVCIDIHTCIVFDSNNRYMVMYTMYVNVYIYICIYI